MLAIRHLYVVQSIGGGRADFVAGWLGTISNFVDVQWTVDVETGKSIILSNFLKEISESQGQQSLDIVLQNYGYCLSYGSNVDLSATYVKSNIQHFASPELAQHIKVIIIDTDDADPQDLFWEYVVKTYMIKNRTPWHWENQQCWGVDQQLISNKIPLSDQSRIEFVDNVVKTWQFRSCPTVLNLSSVIIKYNDLFRPNGSCVLANALGLEVSQQHHNHWNAALSLAKTPNQIDRWGRIWDRQQILNRKTSSDFKIVKNRNQTDHHL